MAKQKNKVAKKTIQSKLLKTILGIILPMFLVTIAIVVLLSVNENRKTSAATERQIRSALISKGNVLVANNAQALSGMVEDNAFLAVQSLVASTYQADENIVYGIYMTDENQAWVFASDSNTEGTISGQVILEDSISLEAAKIEDFAVFTIKNPGDKFEILEFVAQVKIEDDPSGWIRYGFSTESLYKELAGAHAKAIKALIRLIGILFALAIIAFAIATIQAKKQSESFSKPITDLNKAANKIAGGDYREEVKVESDDEVGDLANSFENMRLTVKQYTEHLEELVDAKMRQVRDILDNIDQGLFTVNLDGTINDEYSKATNKILGVEDVAKIDVAKALHFSDSQKSEWSDWLELVKIRLGKLRWEKIERLAPILEFSYFEGLEEKTVEVGYRPVLNNNQELERVMVLVDDVTETRKIEKVIAEEKRRHENEVKTILGLVNNPPEVIADYFVDTDSRLSLIEDNVKLLEEESVRAREQFPDGKQLDINQNTVGEIFRDLHTIKGNSATYGFEEISYVADQAETILEALRPPIETRTASSIEELKNNIEDLKKSREEVENISKRLRGGEDEVVVQIAESKVDYLQSLVKKISSDPNMSKSSLLAPLFEACYQIKYVPLVKLAEKYSTVIERIALKSDKLIDFKVNPEALELAPSFFNPINESLVHLIRNAADHGIEGGEAREALGKDVTGQILLSVSEHDSIYRIELSDDGNGIDAEALAKKAVEKQLVSQEQVDAMNEEQKSQLVFLNGLSSRDDVTETSGRGVGMAAVQANIESLAGSIQMQSRLGEGTSFVMEIPTKSFPVV
ncbi:MAG: HAMP domain-containing protein [Fibrobacter sp.]|nr:HAMP domain-containing protein [Fibrobacter sp.]